MALRSTSAGRRQRQRRQTTSEQSRTEASVSTRFTGLRGSSLIFMLLAIIGSIHTSTMIGIETHRILVNAQEIERLNADIALIQNEIAIMDSVISHTDDVYMEQLARCQGFIFPDETRYMTDLPEEAIEHLSCQPLP